MANWAEQTKHRGGAAVDTISELTSGAGVTADGVLLKDSQVSTDQINELTPNAGVTADGVQMKDGNLETVAVEQLTQQSSTPATPAAGKTKLYVKNDGVAYILNPDGIETPIGSGSTVKRVTQNTHGFAVGEVLYHNGTIYAKAKADDAATAEVVCMVSRVIDSNTFEFVTNSIVTKAAWGLTAGEVYFLSDATAGAITTTEPTTVSHISKPVFVATSATEGVFVNMRGTTVGGTNLFTTISLNNGTATTILNLADDTTFPVGSCGELTGGECNILQSGANTDYIFGFKLLWAKTASNVVNIQPDAMGDVPPGFAFGTSGAAIQVSFTSLGANFESGKVRYAMNAAPLGAQLPLQIDSSRVTQNAVGSGLNPTGAVIPFAGSSAPTGYLLCDGAAVSRTTYAALFAVLSTTFGVGDGSTTFNLPDMRETIPVGVGTRGAGVTAHDTYTLGQFKDDQVQGHYHSLQNNSNNTGTAGNVAAVGISNPNNAATSPCTTMVSDGTNGTPRTGTTTHGKQMGLNYIIKT